MCQFVKHTWYSCNIRKKMSNFGGVFIQVFYTCIMWTLLITLVLHKAQNIWNCMCLADLLHAVLQGSPQLLTVRVAAWWPELCQILPPVWFPRSGNTLFCLIFPLQKPAFRHPVILIQNELTQLTQPMDEGSEPANTCV